MPASKWRRSLEVMAAGRFEYFKLAFFSQPRMDRQLYRLIKQRRVRRVVELGIGSVERAIRIVRVCQRYANAKRIAYAGLDWFEERPEGMGRLSLIDAHRRLQATGAEVRLMPGGAVEGLPSVANALTQTDLLLISDHANEQSLSSAWFYLPRMCHANTLVLRRVAADQSGDGSWATLPIDEIETQATKRAA